MDIMKWLKVTTQSKSPLNALTGNDTAPTVSNFLTIQSFTNFTAMAGAFTLIWGSMKSLLPNCSLIWLPYVLSFVWAGISIWISFEDLNRNNRNGEKKKKRKYGTYIALIFIAVINAFVLASAVVGTDVAVGKLQLLLFN